MASDEGGNGAGGEVWGERESEGSVNKLYPPQRPWELEPYYCRHVEAMTAEGLREKSDIAAQLAARDKRIAELAVELVTLANPAHLDSWNEEDGSVLWWRFPIVEPPYCGTPLDDDFPEYVTHWTRFAIPHEPKGRKQCLE